MRLAVKDVLRDAWFGVDPASVIAARAHLSERQVQRFWESEKRADRLPKSPRPHFAKFAALDLDDAADIDPADDAPIGGPMGVRIPDHDPLLAALIAQHSNDPLRGHLDLVPPQTLQMERNGFPPSASRLRQFYRVRDVLAAALLKRRAARLDASSSSKG